MNSIKDKLSKRGITQVEIARMLNVKPSSVHNVISGKRKTPRIRLAISLATGCSIDELWNDNKIKKAPSSGRNTAVNVGTATTVPEDGDVLQAGM